MRRRQPMSFELLERRELLAVLTDGPMVGGVSDQLAKVFVRTDGKAQVAVEYSTSPVLAGAISTPSVKTLKKSDFTAIISLTGLAPETEYFYRVLVGGVVQQSGNYPSFRTFAAPGTSRDFSFALFGDLLNADKNPNAAAPAYEAGASDDPAFVMQIGDFDHRDPRKISKLRAMHREVRGPQSAAGADFHEHIASAFPVFHVWDDHDYCCNNGDKTYARKAHALQAFKEYYPLPDLPNAAGIWHKFAYAQAEFFMLDTRSQRDPVGDPNTPQKSMLDGDNISKGQKEWLKSGLMNSTATWKFIVSSVAMNPTVEKKDGWAEYPDERREILDFIRSKNITGVIVLSADIHLGGALDDGTHSGLPEMNLPHTNLDNDHVDTTTRPGNWSDGLFSGVNASGYGLVHVKSDQVTLEVKGADGSVRGRMTVDLASVAADTASREIDDADSPDPRAAMKQGTDKHEGAGPKGRPLSERLRQALSHWQRRSIA